MTDERNKDLVRRHFEEIWNHRDLRACEELMAKDFVEHAAAPFADSPPGAVDGLPAITLFSPVLIIGIPQLGRA